MSLRVYAYNDERVLRLYHYYDLSDIEFVSIPTHSLFYYTESEETIIYSRAAERFQHLMRFDK